MKRVVILGVVIANVFLATSSLLNAAQQASKSDDFDDWLEVLPSLEVKKIGGSDQKNEERVEIAPGLFIEKDLKKNNFDLLRRSVNAEFSKLRKAGNFAAIIKMIDSIAKSDPNNEHALIDQDCVCQYLIQACIDGKKEFLEKLFQDSFLKKNKLLPTPQIGLSTAINEVGWVFMVTLRIPSTGRELRIDFLYENQRMMRMSMNGTTVGELTAGIGDLLFSIKYESDGKQSVYIYHYVHSNKRIIKLFGLIFS